jgi:hypothetical protein
VSRQGNSEWMPGARVIVRAPGGWADGQTGTVVGPASIPRMCTVELDDGGRFLARDDELRTTTRGKVAP